MKKTRNLTLTIDIDLHKRLEKEAERRGRSLSNLVTYLLKKQMEKIKEV